jgi:hypothetical protein
VIIFHRLLIGTAIVFCLGFSGWMLLTSREGTMSLVLGGGFLVAGVGLAYYLKNLNRFLHR